MGLILPEDYSTAPHQLSREYSTSGDNCRGEAMEADETYFSADVSCSMDINSLVVESAEVISLLNADPDVDAPSSMEDELVIILAGMASRRNSTSDIDLPSEYIGSVYGGYSSAEGMGFPEEADNECSQSDSDREDCNEIVRSISCEQHSKWKKKCPQNCPHRREVLLSSTAVLNLQRKLWTKNESSMLLKLVKEGNPNDMSPISNELRWIEIAGALSRTVNSTKKKFMRLTNKWSSKRECESVRYTSSDEDEYSEEADLKTRRNPAIRIKLESEPAYAVSGIARRCTRRTPLNRLCDSEDEDYVREEAPQLDEFRVEKRATIVCDKHRRWKKRCPPDCEDKKIEEEKLRNCLAAENSPIIITSPAGIKREPVDWDFEPATPAKRRRGDGRRRARNAGRPALSCRQHQKEHQKCPPDCPRRPYRMKLSGNSSSSSAQSSPLSMRSEQEEQSHATPQLDALL